MVFVRLVSLQVTCDQAFFFGESEKVGKEGPPHHRFLYFAQSQEGVINLGLGAIGDIGE